MEETILQQVKSLEDKANWDYWEYLVEAIINLPEHMFVKPNVNQVRKYVHGVGQALLMMHMSKRFPLNPAEAKRKQKKHNLDDVWHKYKHYTQGIQKLSEGFSFDMMGFIENVHKPLIVILRDSQISAKERYAVPRGEDLVDE